MIVRGSVAACVKQEISEWGKEHGATNLVSGLKGVVEANNLLLEGVRMHMHNSCVFPSPVTGRFPYSYFPQAFASREFVD